MRFSRRAGVTVAVVVGLVAVGLTSMPGLAAGSSVIASESAPARSRSRIVVGRPVGTTAGQVLVASIVASGDAPRFRAPAGWNLVREGSIKGLLRHVVYVKVAGSEEGSSYSWKVDRPALLAGGISTFDGIDPAHPVDAVAGQENDSGVPVASPGVTTTVAKTRLVHLAAVPSSGRIAAPRGMTEEWQVETGASSKDTQQKGAMVSLSQALERSVGPTGGRSAFASVEGPSIGVLLALRPIARPGARASSRDPVLVGAGDIAHCGNDKDEATARLLDDLPGTVVSLGDNVYIDATSRDFSKCYAPTWGRHKARIVPVPGNHEYRTPGANGYFGYFGAAAGDPDKGYYDFRLGAWHVIVLNSGCVELPGCGPDPETQEKWLRSVLAASEAECTVALVHHPRFSSGAAHGSYPQMQRFWEALYDHGADVVLSGHEHVYERFAMQRPDGKADASFGLRQITVGTGGRGRHSFGRPLPNSEVRGRATGVLEMVLHDESYSWEFVPVAGQAFTDSGTAACHGAPGLKRSSR